MNYKIPKVMKAAVLFGPDDLRVSEYPVPVPGPFEVLVKVMSCAICGSDPTVIAGHWTVKPDYGNFIPGHEFSGLIVNAGPNVFDFEPGDRIAIETHKGCGYCKNCKRGKYTVCLNYGKTETGHRHYGFTNNGGYAQYAVVNVSNLHKLADNLSYDEEIGRASCRERV